MSAPPESPAAVLMRRFYYAAVLHSQVRIGPFVYCVTTVVALSKS